MSTNLLSLAPLVCLVVFVLWRIRMRRRLPRSPAVPGAAASRWDALIGVLAALTLLNS